MTEEEIKELQAKVAELTEANEKITKNRDDILNEKKSVQKSSQEKDLAIEEARKVAAKSEEERLKLAGDVDGLKKHYEEQLATATAEANEQAKSAKDALLSRDKSSSLNSVLNLIHDDFKDVSSAMLSNMLEISYNDQGQAITEFKHNGEVVAKSVDEFKGWAGEQPAFKKILNGVDSSGASTTRSSTGGTVSDKKWSEMNMAEKTAHMNSKHN